MQNDQKRIGFILLMYFLSRLGVSPTDHSVTFIGIISKFILHFQEKVEIKL